MRHTDKRYEGKLKEHPILHEVIYARPLKGVTDQVLVTPVVLAIPGDIGSQKAPDVHTSHTGLPARGKGGPIM